METQRITRMPAQYQPGGGPLRWQDDITGELPQAVYAFFHVKGADSITPRQIELVRDYCDYYINCPIWKTETMELTFADLRERAKTLRSTKAIEQWLKDALEVGIDPF